MKYIIILLIIFVLLLIPCINYHKSIDGIYYTSRNDETANVMNALRSISFSLSDKLPEKDSKLLKASLVFTTFKELNGDSPRVLAWNYDKGREIAIRIYDSRGNVYPARQIIRALLHEMAHTLTKTNGHGLKFQQKNAMLQKYKELYVNTLLNNTFINK